MSPQPLTCPCCRAGPLLSDGLHARCPNGCVFEHQAIVYLDRVGGGEPVELAEEMEGLDLGDYEWPVYLGYACEPGYPPLLACVAQTAGQAMAILRWDYDLRQMEPVVVALLGCVAANWTQQRRAA